MFRTTRIRLLALIMALFAFVGSAGAADPGGVTLRNDTSRVVVVQCTVAGSGQPRRCKPVRLLPGESLREPCAAPTLKVEVFDGPNPAKSLFSGTLSVTPETPIFSISADGRTVVVVPVPSH